MGESDRWKAAYPILGYWSTAFYIWGAMAKSIYSAAQQRLQKLLRQARADAGLSQVELAARLGKPQSFVSKYESGERRLDLVELQQICMAVGIDLIKFVKAFNRLRA